jgi:3,4-dihydroxyphenylacetate 2,3-dioxygenase
MNAAAELIAEPPAAVPFDVMRSSFVELQVPDLEAAEHFYVDLLGMILTARGDDAIYLRGWEERQHHSLILRRGSVAAVARIAFRVRSEADLDAAAEHLSGLGMEIAWRQGEDPGMGRSLRLWDPYGEPLELYYEMEQRDSQLQRFDLHRGAPLLRFDHFNLHSPRLEDAYRFWLGLGFRCSEYISTDGDDERLTGAWLLRKPGVHDVALTAGRGPRLHHFAYWVGEPLGVLRACDQLAAGGHSDAIERGPGRHGVSNAFFVYLRDPAGHRIELYSCDYYTGDPDHKPLRWSVSDPRCRSFWGTRAPDSWYEESSLLLGRDGHALETVEATVDERDSHSEVMA